MIQRSIHLCAQEGHPEFAKNFRARYEAKDLDMFNNDFLKFDIDNELDAVRKAKAFVAEVSLPLPPTLIQQASSQSGSTDQEISNTLVSKGTSQDILDQALKIDEEERKILPNEPMSMKQRNRMSRVI